MDGNDLLLWLNAAAFGALLASGFLAWRIAGKAKKTMSLIDHVQGDINRSMAAARRVLENPIVKGEPREAILILLHGLANREFGLWLVNRISAVQPDEARGKSSLMQAIDEIREMDPVVADDLDLAMVGISTVALPMTYKIGEVAEMAARSPTSERRVADFVGGILQMRQRLTEGQMSFSV
ncbi:hypothetical protein J2T09_002411 [Neorhizobium huautlense]|uniref:Uncharacterized protein n=1 Tax=Neorhizobium huautlense TaxID=67774 RepID=A0ABT9PVA5_9HYPH|nr:hypothetical protein [Neorhizobium huautlense]MDP9837654.1 hypothetical protein [Neorhizobium huautlense]